MCSCSHRINRCQGPGYTHVLPIFLCQQIKANQIYILFLLCTYNRVCGENISFQTFQTLKSLTSEAAKAMPYPKSQAVMLCWHCASQEQNSARNRNALCRLKQPICFSLFFLRWPGHRYSKRSTCPRYHFWAEGFMLFTSFWRAFLHSLWRKNWKTWPWNESIHITILHILLETYLW